MPSLRTELVQFLLEDLNALNSQAVSSLSSTRALPNLYHLLELDTEATLDVLRYAFVEDEITKPDVSLHDSTDANMEAGKEIDLMGEIQNLLVQNTVNALIHILDISQKNRSSGSSDIGSLELWPSKKDMGHLFEFVAYYVACKRANVSKTVLSQILEYLTSENKLPQSSSKESVGTLKRREKQVLALLEVVPEKDWDASYVLHLCEKAEFYQVFFPVANLLVTLSQALQGYEILYLVVIISRFTSYRLGKLTILVKHILYSLRKSYGNLNRIYRIWERIFEQYQNINPFIQFNRHYFVNAQGPN